MRAEVMNRFRRASSRVKIIQSHILLIMVLFLMFLSKRVRRQTSTKFELRKPNWMREKCSDDDKKSANSPKRRQTQ